MLSPILHLSEDTIKGEFFLRSTSFIPYHQYRSLRPHDRYDSTILSVRSTPLVSRMIFLTTATIEYKKSTVIIEAGNNRRRH